MLEETQQDKDKSELLTKLKELGIDASSGRKVRNDKGKTRGPNSHIRSDAGIKRTSYINMSPKMKTYFIVKSRLLNRTISNEDESLQLDHNNIFIVINRKNKSIHGNNQVVYRGKAIHRTVKYIKGKSLDLERLRFEALQESLFDDMDSRDCENFWQEIEALNIPDYPIFLDLFCALYHVEPQDAPRWKYDDWRTMYNLVSDDILSKDFIFKYNERPGTEAFSNKYGNELTAYQVAQLMEFTRTKAYINEKARYRDLLLSKEKEYYRQELLKDPASESWSINKLTREINKRIDKNQIDKQVEEYMRVWSRNKLGIKE